MGVHVVTIVLGYAGASWLQVPATTWDLVTTYGGVLLSVAGTACLVMVVVTSVKKARKRLRYESWHLLHLYAYLGVGLALPHQLWTGQELLLLDRSDALLVGPVDRGRRRRAGLAGCCSPSCGACGTGCG